MLLRKLMRLALRLAFAVAPALPAYAGDCDVDFGDKLYAWVQEDSSRQALQLAKADFASRAFNGRVVEYDALRAESARLAAYLDDYAAQAKSETDRLAGLPPDVRTAVAMQVQTSEALTKLVEAGQSLESMNRRLVIVSAQPAFNRFVYEGAQHVGRYTLLESVLPIGNEQAQRLNARFAVRVEMNFDENGEAQQTEGMLPGDEHLQAADKTAVTVLYYVDEPYSKAVAAVYLVARFVLWGKAAADCADKIAHQKKRSSEAVTLLASTLPTIAQTFALYEEQHRAAIKSFAPVHAQFQAAHTTLEERWRGLMAINLARATLASNVLTAEKLEALRKAYGTQDPLAKLFDSTALANLVIEVGELQSATINRELALAKACRDVAGVRAAEDLVDAKLFGAASLRELEAVGTLAPVAPTLAGVRRRLERPSPKAQAILKGAAAAECKVPASGLKSSPWFKAAPATFMHLAPAKPEQVRSGSQIGIKGRRLSASSLLRAKSVDTPKAALSYTALLTDSFCIILKQGGSYRCGSAPTGPALSSELGSGRDPAYDEVSNWSKDGGFARDAQKTSADIQQARANIERRIEEMVQRQASINEALPAWLSGSTAGMRSAVAVQAEVAKAEGTFRGDFFAAHVQMLKSASERLNKFAQEPSDKSVLTTLVRQSGTVDTSVPAVPRAAIVPGLPAISGIPADAGAYAGGSSLVQKMIVREQRKGEGAADTEGARLRTRALYAAGQFARLNTSTGNAIAEALIEDATALRYTQGGVLPNASIAVVSDAGIVTRIPYQGGSLPANSVLRRTEAYAYSSRSLTKQIELTQQSLSPGATDRDARMRALQSSSGLLTQSEGVFYGGDVALGEALLEAGQIVADLVTSWAPGISWARDVYESVSGLDLISGRNLENWERGAAVFGVVSAGIGSKGVKAVKAMRSLEKTGLSVRRAEHVIDTARHIDSMAAKPSLHALEKMAKEGIDHDSVELVLDTGSRFFDVQKGGILIAETGLSAGARRVAAVVDPDTLVDAERLLIRTVFPEFRTDAELVKVLIENTDRLRYIKLPDPL